MSKTQLTLEFIQAITFFALCFVSIGLIMMLTTQSAHLNFKDLALYSALGTAFLRVMFPIIEG